MKSNYDAYYEIFLADTPEKEGEFEGKFRWAARFYSLAKPGVIIGTIGAYCGTAPEARAAAIETCKAELEKFKKVPV